MIITGDWISSEATQAVCQTLEAKGFKALFVGGCVRNALLGEPITDIDIATDATPESVLQAFDESGFKTVPTGIDHGTVTVVVDKDAFEITTFREDVTTDGRHAKVSFSQDVREDARRRDFTVNALYAASSGAVLDPLGGLPDIQTRTIRFIEDAETRIREDYLRILRFFRFHAAYGNPQAGLDKAGLAACGKLHAGIAYLSKERVGAEMRKLLSTVDPRQSVSAMAETAVLESVLSDANDVSLSNLITVEMNMDIAPDPMRRLAALGGEDVEECLRLSRKEQRDLEVLTREASASKEASLLGYEYGFDMAVNILALSAARSGKHVRERDLTAVKIGSAVEFPVNSSDLKAFYQGKELGDALRRLEDIWIESNFLFSKEQLLRQLS